MPQPIEPREGELSFDGQEWRMFLEGEWSPVSETEPGVVDALKGYDGVWTNPATGGQEFHRADGGGWDSEKEVLMAVVAGQAAAPPPSPSGTGAVAASPPPTGVFPPPPGWPESLPWPDAIWMPEHLGRLPGGSYGTIAAGPDYDKARPLIELYTPPKVPRPPQVYPGLYSTLQEALQAAAQVPGSEPAWDSGSNGYYLKQAAAPEPERRRSLQEMIEDALVEGTDEGEERAFRLHEFQTQPTSLQRLNAALALASSPSDYFSLVSLARGEIEPFVKPVWETGTPQRIAPMAPWLQQAAQQFFRPQDGTTPTGSGVNWYTPPGKPVDTGIPPIGMNNPEAIANSQALEGQITPGAMGPPWFPPAVSLPGQGESGDERAYYGGGTPPAVVGPPLPPPPLLGPPPPPPGIAYSGIENQITPGATRPPFYNPLYNVTDPAAARASSDAINAAEARAQALRESQERDRRDLDINRGFSRPPQFTLPESLRQVGIRGQELGPPKYWFQVGGLRYPSARSWGNMLPMEQSIYRRQVEQQGIPWEDYESDRRRWLGDTTPGQVRRRPPVYFNPVRGSPR